MIGLPWRQHVAFLDDRRLTRRFAGTPRRRYECSGSHPAALLFCLGNEIPPSVVRWHGRARVERFLRDLYAEVKAASPDSLLTYVNFPPTEYLDARLLRRLRLQRLPASRSRICAATWRGSSRSPACKPLLLAEAGADSIREGPDGQAQITAMHVRAAFEEGLCGAVAFSWTDEWWRGGHDGRRLGLRPGRSRAPAEAGADRRVAGVCRCAVQRAAAPHSGPRCRWSSARTTPPTRSTTVSRRCRSSRIPTSRSSSSTTARATRRARSRIATPDVRVIDIPNGGLSAARNVGLAAATGEIVAYTDADVRVDPDWLTYLVQPFVTSDVVGSGGPNVVPARRSVRRSVRRPVARRSDAGAARRPHRRARARLQHGVPPQTRCSRSAGSTRSISGPATTSTSAGGCRRKARRSASRRPRSCGITIVRRSRPIGASRSDTAKARPGSTRIIPRSSSAAT